MISVASNNKQQLVSNVLAASFLYIISDLQLNRQN